MSQTSKYILYISVVLNGILLMSVVGIIPFLLYLSVVVNLILIWFSVKCLNNASGVEEDLEELMNKTDSFVEHLERIYELENRSYSSTLLNLLQRQKRNLSTLQKTRLILN